MHDEGVDDLDLDTIVSIFSADLVRRGLDEMDPVEPLNDPAWAKTLTSTYMHGTA